MTTVPVSDVVVTKKKCFILTRSVVPTRWMFISTATAVLNVTDLFQVFSSVMLATS